MKLYDIYDNNINITLRNTKSDGTVFSLGGVKLEEKNLFSKFAKTVEDC